MAGLNRFPFGGSMARSLIRSVTCFSLSCTSLTLMIHGGGRLGWDGG
jgi:hypothetical protein